MNYYDISWHHHFADEPYRIVSEIGEDRYETRKVEFFENGVVGFAFQDAEKHTTGLGEVPVPELAEIVADQQFTGEEIERREFERLWQVHVLPQMTAEELID